MENWTPFGFGLKKLIEENKIHNLLDTSADNLAQSIIDYIMLLGKFKRGDEAE